ncbi:lasso peptide biosynthesis PqqD family chaperone [Jeotgalibacillus sp. ET6]|uniref:lasso peptide biosynthesis PqqD family chaperone n=1 Tax=Jeotgalibacillus sp. ET6 TaxID=3037260 RepID=UPI00241856A5|nr:lasso peptide biosynthesis PqqD family chaperone [Jeotgalibacillus sp. ET6]MDG5472621.1 lasso peptide biosynthesis PqqD family chaperone [Jeotgalibacillus sp. ET6]
MNDTQALSKEQTVAQQPGNVVSNMDGEIVMLSIENGKYYNLGEIGGAIWEKIEQPMSISSLIDGLMEEYEVDAFECEQQVMSFLDQLAKENLVAITDAK